MKSSYTHTHTRTQTCCSVASHNCYTTCPGICIYQEECYCQIAQGMKLSNTEHLLVTCTLHAENSQLETDVCSLRSGMGLTFCQEAGQWPSSGIVPILM